MNTESELLNKINKIEEVLNVTLLFEESNRDKKIIRKEYQTKNGKIFEIYLKTYISYSLDCEDLLLSLEISRLGELIDYKLLVDKTISWVHEKESTRYINYEELITLINNI